VKEPLLIRHIGNSCFSLFINLNLNGFKLALLAALLSTPLFAQQFGGIRGQVVDSDFGQPIAKASVTIMGSPFGAITDDQGNFTISGVPPGVYTIQTRAPSYIPKTVPDISVAAGAFNEMRFEAVAEVEEMEELVVPGDIEKASETGLLAERQNASAVMDMIGQDFISRLGAANAGDAMKRMVGTSVADGKYVAVRGMPDRYVNTLLNGGRLPSTDPDKRAINVDLFPGSILESINTYKTFTPDQPADFTGGSVDICTRTFPDKPSFGTGITMEYNSQTTFNPNFLTYSGGGTGLFGGKANSRMIPQSVIDTVTPRPDFLRGGVPGALEAADRVDSAMRQMSPVIGLTNKTPPPNMSFNLQGGDSVELGPDGEQVGVIGAFSYRNKYSFYDDGQRGTLFLSPTPTGFSPGYSSRQQSQGKQEVLWGGLVGLSGQWDKDNKASMNVMYNRGADDNAVQRNSVVGPNSVNTQQIIDYGQRSLSYLQLLGEDRFEELRNLKINWNGGLGQANLEQPDQRQFSYNLDNGTYSQVDGTSGVPATSVFNPTLYRFQRELTENSYYGIVDFTVPMFEKKETTDAFKTGFYTDYSQRSYNQASFNYVYGGYNTPSYTSYTPTDGSTWADVFLNKDRSGLVDPTAGPGDPYMSYSLFNQQGEAGASTGTFYDAKQAVTASYVMTEFNIFPQLHLVGGTRFENTNINIKGGVPLPPLLFPPSEYPNFAAGGSGIAKIEQLDLLPAVGSTFNVMDNVNIRLAWSQTLARPSFKELGPVLTKDFTSAEYFLGNPNLQLSHANNYDFRAEWFPRAGEVIAVSLFYKDIQQPMEQQSKYNETLKINYLQYANAQPAQVYGIEIETRKRLDQVAAWLKNFSIFFNYSQIQSSVPLPSDVATILKANGQSTSNRPLQGQPDYIINAGLNYDNDEYKFYAGLYYNVTGPFLYAVGQPFVSGADTNYLPDIYEQPAPSLDFNLTQGLTDNWRLTLRGKNLLNPVFSRTQTYNGTEYTYSSYTKGWDLSMSASYSF
jgi:TonB-dependent receptor